jgi:hypothetical protein
MVNLEHYALMGLLLRLLLKYRHNAHPMKEDPMKEDVKGKSFSPPLREMRVW